MQTNPDIFETRSYRKVSLFKAFAISFFIGAAVCVLYGCVSGNKAEVNAVTSNAVNYVRVPQRVSPRQLRLALIDAGVLPDQVTATIAAISDPTMKAKAMTEWEHATFYDRSNLTVSAIGAMVGLSSAQIDQLFVVAEGK